MTEAWSCESASASFWRGALMYDQASILCQHFTLGNIMSALWFETALEAHPEVQKEMAQGELGTLRCWLTENVHQHGRKYTILELVERVAGGPLSIDAYIRYLQIKYAELYGLSFC